MSASAIEQTEFCLVCQTDRLRRSKRAISGNQYVLSKRGGAPNVPIKSSWLSPEIAAQYSNRTGNQLVTFLSLFSPALFKNYTIYFAYGWKNEDIAVTSHEGGVVSVCGGDSSLVFVIPIEVSGYITHESSYEFRRHLSNSETNRLWSVHVPYVRSAEIGVFYRGTKVYTHSKDTLFCLLCPVFQTQYDW